MIFSMITIVISIIGFLEFDRYIGYMLDNATENKVIPIGIDIVFRLKITMLPLIFVWYISPIKFANGNAKTTYKSKPNTNPTIRGV